MSNEDDLSEKSIFRDFSDTEDILELDHDLTKNEEAMEMALKNIVSQMAGTDDEVSSDISYLNAEAEQNNNQETNPAENQNTEAENNTEEQNIEKNEAPSPEDKEEIEEENIHNTENGSIWESIKDSNEFVKKYIVYISKDLVPYIDDLSIDDRSSYINDAIQRKVDLLDAKKQALVKRNAFIHSLIAVIIAIIFTPIGLFFAHKAIMVTFDNYKYSQDNFEKLYKHRFEHDRAYMRSIKYNEELKKKAKDN